MWPSTPSNIHAQSRWSVVEAFGPSPPSNGSVWSLWPHHRLLVNYTHLDFTSNCDKRSSFAKSFMIITQSVYVTVWHFYFQELRKVKLSLPFTPSPLTQDAPGVSTLLSLRFDRFWRLWPPTSYWERTESGRHGWSLCRPAAPWQFFFSSDITAQYLKFY